MYVCVCVCVCVYVSLCVCMCVYMCVCGVCVCFESIGTEVNISSVSGICVFYRLPNRLSKRT